MSHCTQPLPASRANLHYPGGVSPEAFERARA